MRSLLLIVCLLCVLRVSSGQQRAVAYFNRGGFVGPVLFYRNATSLYVDFSRLNFTTTGDVEVDVHRFPVQIGQTSDPCAESVIGDHETPDITTSLTMANKATWVTSIWELVGPKGILGRAIALHQGANEACATVKPIPANRMMHPPSCGTMGSGGQENELEAVFNGKVSGRVSFRALSDSNLTGVVSHLFYTDGTANTTGNPWHEHVGNCTALGMVRQDFTTSHGSINIGSAGMSPTSRWVSSGEIGVSFMSLIGKPLALHYLNGTVLACAYIRRVKQRSFTANFGNDGTVKVLENSRFSGSEVDVRLTSTPTSMNIRQYSSSGSCAMSGSTFNPFNRANQTMSGRTPDQYPTGNIGQKFPRRMTSKQCDNTVSLFGHNSVARRSVSIVVNGMQKCADLQEDLASGDQLMQAKAIFNSGPVRGMMMLQQVRNSDGTMGITTINSTGLMSMTGSNTMNHNFHVHIGRKGYQNTTTACDDAYAQGHFNPFNVDYSSSSNYADDCGPTNPLRCEVGDTSMKTGTVNVDNQGVLRQDTYLPLMGSESVMGRSFVIHGAGKAAARYACANIIPMSAQDVQIGVRTNRLPSGGFNATVFRNMVRQSSSSASNVDVLYTQAYTDTSSGCTYISAAIDGTNAASVANGLSRADLGTSYSQTATECTQGVSFAAGSSAGTFSSAFSLALLLAAAAALLF